MEIAERQVGDRGLRTVDTAAAADAHDDVGRLFANGLGDAEHVLPGRVGLCARDGLARQTDGGGIEGLSGGLMDRPAPVLPHAGGHHGSAFPQRGDLIAESIEAAQPVDEVVAFEDLQ